MAIYSWQLSHFDQNTLKLQYFVINLFVFINFQFKNCEQNKPVSPKLSGSFYINILMFLFLLIFLSFRWTKGVLNNCCFYIITAVLLITYEFETMRIHGNPNSSSRMNEHHRFRLANEVSKTDNNNCCNRLISCLHYSTMVKLTVV